VRVADQLPQPVQSVLAQASDLFSQAIGVAAQNPNAAAIAAAPLLGVAGVAWLASRFSGYGGSKPVLDVAELLQVRAQTAADAEVLACAHCLPCLHIIQSVTSCILVVALPGAWRVTAGRQCATQTKDAVLVDIRSERDRETQGQPLLAKRALGKGASVPPLSLGNARGK